MIPPFIFIFEIALMFGCAASLGYCLGSLKQLIESKKILQFADEILADWKKDRANLTSMINVLENINALQSKRFEFKVEVLARRNSEIEGLKKGMATLQQKNQKLEANQKTDVI